jgi:hypothetical protein
MNIQLSELQRTYRAQLHASRRDALRSYLIDGDEPTASAFRLVSRRLYADGLIDNLGLAFHWVASASLAERARLFSAITTTLLFGDQQ